MERKKEIEISTGVVFRTILILLALWFLYSVLDIIMLVFVSVIIVAAIEPLVDYLQKKKIPRTASVLGVYSALLLMISFSIYFLIPPLVNQSREFSDNLPSYFQSFGNFMTHLQEIFRAKNITLDVNQFGSNFSNLLSSLPQNIFSGTVGVFSTFISVIIVFSLVFYMSVEEDGIKKFIYSISPTTYRDYAAGLTLRIKEKIGKWMLGQLFMMLVVFIMVSLGMTLIGMPYALILGLFAGVMEIIPYIGPIVCSIPGIILGFLISPTMGFLAVLIYVITQLLEGQVIVPQVMKKAVGLNPILVIIALLIGVRLGGVMGAVLAIPTATAISLFINDLIEKKKV